MKSCQLVVRFDLPNTAQSYIQVGLMYGWLLCPRLSTVSKP